MQAIENKLRERAAQLLADGTVTRVLGWRPGDFPEELTPGLLASADELVYNEYCAANLSKYLMTVLSGCEGKVLALIKPCDSYALNLLTGEHRIDREKVYALGLPCGGMRGKDGEILERCKVCQKTECVGCDEALDCDPLPRPAAEDPYARVREVESLPPEKRFLFWQDELSKCIRCNACRNACPACSCIQCVFDNPASGVAAKASPDDFEDQLFHIIRAFHVAGRCVDCGECSRVCPQHIPLHLLNRKLIKDMDGLYGEYQAGADVEGRAPLTNYSQDDPDPRQALKGGEHA